MYRVGENPEEWNITDENQIQTKLDEPNTQDPIALLLALMSKLGVSLENLTKAKNEQDRQNQEEKLNSWKLENKYLDENQVKTQMDELLYINTDNYNLKQFKEHIKNIQKYHNYENPPIPNELKIKATAIKKVSSSRAVGPAEQFRAKCNDLNKYPIGSSLMFKCPHCPKTYFSSNKLTNHITKEDIRQEALNKPLHSSKTFLYAEDTIENRIKWARS